MFSSELDFSLIKILLTQLIFFKEMPDLTIKIFSRIDNIGQTCHRFATTDHIYDYQLLLKKYTKLMLNRSS